MSGYYIFPSENQIPWIQNFRGYPSNAPGNVLFEKISDYKDGHISLAADGYGKNPYGCGAICVNEKLIEKYKVDHCGV